jgi:acyl carrier protein
MSTSIGPDDVRAIIQNARTKVNVERLANADNLRDAGADSLDMMTIVLDVSEKAGIEVPDEDVEELSSIDEIVAYISRRTADEATRSRSSAHGATSRETRPPSTTSTGTSPAGVDPRRRGAGSGWRIPPAPARCGSSRSKSTERAGSWAITA